MPAPCREGARAVSSSGHGRLLQRRAVYVDCVTRYQQAFLDERLVARRLGGSPAKDDAEVLADAAWLCRRAGSASQSTARATPWTARRRPSVRAWVRFSAFWLKSVTKACRPSGLGGW